MLQIAIASSGKYAQLYWQGVQTLMSRFMQQTDFSTDAQIRQ